MERTTIPRNVVPAKTDDVDHAEILAELRTIHADLRRLAEIVDRFAGVYLNSKFPYGRPTDRWSRRRD